MVLKIEIEHKCPLLPKTILYYNILHFLHNEEKNHSQILFSFFDLILFIHKTLRERFRGKLTCISIFFTCFPLIFVMEKSLSYFTPFTHEQEIKSIKNSRFVIFPGKSKKIYDVKVCLFLWNAGTNGS